MLNRVDQDHEAASENVWPEISGINTELCQEQFDGDFEFFADLLKRLLEDFDFFTHGIALPATDDEWIKLSEQAHTLCGSAGMLCAMELSKTAKQVQLLAKQRDEVEILEPISLIGDCIKAIRSSFQKHVQEVRAPEVPPSAGPLAYSEWLDDLRFQRYRAVRDFEVLSEQVGDDLTGSEMRALRNAIYELDFDRALEILGEEGLKVGPANSQPSAEVMAEGPNQTVFKPHVF